MVGTGVEVGRGVKVSVGGRVSVGTRVDVAVRLAVCVRVDGRAYVSVAVTVGLLVAVPMRVGVQVRGGGVCVRAGGRGVGVCARKGDWRHELSAPPSARRTAFQSTPAVVTASVGWAEQHRREADGDSDRSHRASHGKRISAERPPRSAGSLPAVAGAPAGVSK